MPSSILSGGLGQSIPSMRPVLSPEAETVAGLAFGLAALAVGLLDDDAEVTGFERRAEAQTAQPSALSRPGEGDADYSRFA